MKRLYALMVVLLLLSPSVLAEGELSAAEQEALAAIQPDVGKENQIKLCQHVLVYGTEDQKAELLAYLDGKTCTQSVNTTE